MGINTPFEKPSRLEELNGTGGNGGVPADYVEIKQAIQMNKQLIEGLQAEIEELKQSSGGGGGDVNISIVTFYIDGFKFYDYSSEMGIGYKHTLYCEYGVTSASGWSAIENKDPQAIGIVGIYDIPIGLSLTGWQLIGNTKVRLDFANSKSSSESAYIKVQVAFKHS